MAEMKQVAGSRLVEDKVFSFVEMVPLSKEDIKQRAVDEAEHAARALLPLEKTVPDIIAELEARLAKLENNRP